MTAPRLAGFVLLLAACPSYRGGADAPSPTNTEPAVEAKAHPSAPPTPTKPTETMEQQHTLLSADDDFFAADASVSTRAVRDLARSGFRGLAIDAPFALDVAARDRLPILGIFAREGELDPTFMRQAVLVLVETHGPGMRVVPAFEPMAGDEVGDGPAGGPSSGVAIQRFGLDVRARLDELPWGPASWRVYVAHQGHLSNGVTVTLSGEGTRAVLPPPPAAQAEATSGQPSGSGLSVSAPASAVTEPGSTVLLEGALASGDPRSVGLLALGPAPSPFVTGLAVAADGTFAVNLLGDNPLPKAPGTWHVYAFSGEHVAGPATIELTPGSKPW